MHKLALLSLPLGLAAASTLAASFGSSAASQQDAPLELSHHAVRGTVHVLQEARSGNIGVCVGDDGILMIDDQFLPNEAAIRKELAALHPGKVHTLINTHFHGDHTGGNPAFGAEATILAHDHVRERLLNGQPRMAAVGLPDITYSSTVTLHFNGEEICVRHFPNCHTDGDSVVQFVESNVVHMGDLYFQGRFPFVDLASGGSVQGLLLALGELIETLPQDVKVVPGHGEVTDLAGLEEYRAMIESTLDFVAKALEAGKTKEEIQAAGLPPQYKSLSWAFIPEARWIDTLVNSIEAEDGRP